MSYGAWIRVKMKEWRKEVKSATGKLRHVELDGQDNHLCFCSKWNGKSLGRFDEKRGMVLYTL